MSSEVMSLVVSEILTVWGQEFVKPTQDFTSDDIICQIGWCLGGRRSLTANKEVRQQLNCMGEIFILFHQCRTGSICQRENGRIEY